MKIEKVRLCTENAWHEMSLENDSYTFRDVSLSVNSLGEVKITSDTTAVAKFEVEFENKYFQNALILGDAWERAYANLEWKMPNINRVMPWYFLADDKEKVYCFGVKTQPNAMCSWQCDETKILLYIDVKNGTLDLSLNGRVLDACTIVNSIYSEDAIIAAKKFCKLMCDNPRLPNRIIYGGNDWYCNYGDNSFDKILTHARRIVECMPDNAPKPYMVIDDGWEMVNHPEPPFYFTGGPWKYGNYRFGDMKKMAEAIEKEGAIPGIWYRPLQTVESLPEDAVRVQNGMIATIDISTETGLDVVRQDITRFREWGYKLIKHDYSSDDIFGRYHMTNEELYGKEVEFADKTRTTAEIVKSFYRTIREAAGDDVLIIGCNTMSHLSAGIFDIQRTGDDTSGKNWRKTVDFGVNTLAFRMAQHNTFYCVDADCIGITNEIDWDKNKLWLDVLSKSGTPLFVSIGDDAYTDEVKKDLKKAFERVVNTPITSYALDWQETKTPQKWVSFYGEDEYEWNQNEICDDEAIVARQIN